MPGYGIAPLEVYASDRDVLQLFAGAEVERHSNVFALPDGVSPLSSYGNTSRSDTVFRGLVGISFDRQVSLQRFRLDAYALPVKFVEYSNFDNVGYSLGGHWDWAVGRPWFGTLGARLTSTLTPFGTYFVSSKNLERRARVYGSAGFRFTPRWAAFVGLDTETLDNSFSGVDAADFRFVSTETGLRYAPGTGTEVDFVWRRTSGEYPNRQVVDELGNLLPGAVDNEFTQNSLLARLQVRPSDDSRIAGRIGFTSREFENLSQRDFSGVTAGLNLDWMPSGAFTMRVELIRDIQSEELLTASYVDLTSLRLTPSLRLTGKVTLFGRAILSRASYEGDPGFVLAGSPRKDDIRIFGIGLGYEYARNITVNLEARQTNRDSNYSTYEYSDTMLLANVLARF
ncbi:outer membrane beta-barrel protein [Burkholderiaceae bacterium FT117]|uniref:XrtB/PEP-CTERM-associated polysaccharide biosynthesis outer membrane protein EpsL n=1 Tax=Zeimonas sediminis TaxID=2944268 RepID=UPI0023431DD6|nr:XrtB/PEP-CTERM-associated polysaccharide biosynthesis outer membrane protein EpsL [Zeimonas sediminis]MCM5571734.1 outer membrane beta-barrel protein [Zeimonas sediminis]